MTHMTETPSDDEYMQLAIDQARAAGAAGNVPVGAVIVIDDQVIGTGRNRRRENNDPTAHAEIEALRQASTHVGNWRIEGTLYVTQEPCPMCAGALVNARIAKLVYGCANPKAGAVHTLYSIPTDPRLNHRMEVVSGVRGAECGQLLTSFFTKLRRGDREAEGA